MSDRELAREVDVGGRCVKIVLVPGRWPTALLRDPQGNWMDGHAFLLEHLQEISEALPEHVRDLLVNGMVCRR